MITNWTQILDGDDCFKDNDMSDKGKPWCMRIINYLTTFFQIQRDDVKDKSDGEDHSEKFHWLELNGELCLRVSSSTNEKGVRTMPFRRWAEEEGNPRIVIVRRDIPYLTEDINRMKMMIAKDEGLKYPLVEAIDALLSKREETTITEEELEERGIFCSETTSRWSGDKYWVDMLPKLLKERKLKYGHHIVYDGKALDLYKIISDEKKV